MNNATHFFARQPILDKNEQIYGYEFFYRNEKGESCFDNARSATAAVLVNLVNQMGLHSSGGDAKLFVNIDSGVLQSDILLSIPPERFVFELPVTTVVSIRVRELMQMLHGKGYRFAVDNATDDSDSLTAFDPVLPYIDYVKFNTMETDIDLLPATVARLKGKKLIAQRVEIPEVFEAYRDMGFDYFQGYFFAKLHLIKHNRIDPKHLGVIRIYNMLLGGTPMQQVSEEFKRHNELMLQFLQYVNSIGIADGSPNNSVEELLEKVGSDRLEQWLMMIIYSKSTRTVAAKKSPLSLMAEQRIDIMSTIIKTLHPLEEKRLCDQARLVAFISLMESVLNVPLAALLKQIQVDDDIGEALLAQSGRLGKIFALTLAVEKDDYAAAQVLLHSLSLDTSLYDELENLKKI